MRTFKLTINEDELKALINHHRYQGGDYNIEWSSRIHDLTKRINKRNDDTVDVETETENQSKVEGWT